MTSKKAKIKQTSEEHKSGLKLILGTPEIICIGSHARIVAEYEVVDDVIIAINVVISQSKVKVLTSREVCHENQP